MALSTASRCDVALSSFDHLFRHLEAVQKSTGLSHHTQTTHMRSDGDFRTRKTEQQCAHEIGV